MAAQVPGLTRDWSQHQLDLLELVEHEATRRPRRRLQGGHCTSCGHSHRAHQRQACARCSCTERPAPVQLVDASSANRPEGTRA